MGDLHRREPEAVTGVWMTTANAEPQTGTLTTEQSPIISCGRPDVHASAIVEKVANRLPAVEHCYDVALRLQPSLAGVVKVRFNYAQSGAAENISVVETSLGHSDLEACVVDVVRSIAFEPHKAPYLVVVSYPFRFSVPDEDR